MRQRTKSLAQPLVNFLHAYDDHSMTTAKAKLLVKRGFLGSRRTTDRSNIKRLDGY
jgi:hypothetical protein